MNNKEEIYKFIKNLVLFDEYVWRLDYSNRYNEMIKLMNTPESINNLPIERCDDISRKIYACTIEMFSIKQKIKSLFNEVKRTIQLNIKYNE